MFEPRVKISHALLEKVKKAAEAAGCSSVEEFVEKALAREAERVIQQARPTEISASEVEEISKKLKGLGYLD